MASYMAGLFCTILRAQRTRGELPSANIDFINHKSDSRTVWQIAPGNRAASAYALRDYGGGCLYAPANTPASFVVNDLGLFSAAA